MAADDAVVPDTKDWTWVLTRPCPDCGFDPEAVAGPDIAALTRVGAAAWAGVLGRADARDRPAPGVWSPLEYACHVRDVYRLFDQRLVLMLAEQHPTFANWDQDETAVAGRYGEQDPHHVAAELAAAAETVAARFDTVRGEGWARTGRRTGDGATFTVETFGRYFVHDWRHHLHDVGADA
jgi:DinB family protein